jgi:arylsulfatase
MRHSTILLRIRTSIHVALLTTILLCSCSPAEKKEKTHATPNKSPNILLILADDLGYSDLGSYGGEIETPNLDNLAYNGVRLTSFYTMGRCCPSRASILTGLYSHRVGLGHMIGNLNQPGYQGRVSDDAVTIAQILQSSGYRTFMSGKWHLGTDDPTEHGFEEYFGTLVSAQTFWDPNHYTRQPSDRETRQYEAGKFYGTTALTDYALDFLEKSRSTPDKPWFLYLAYNAPHFPLQAPKEAIKKYAETYQVGWDVIRQQRYQKMKELGIIPEETPLTPRSKYWDWAETEAGVNPAWNDVPEDRKPDLARRMAIFAAMIDVMDQNIGRLIAELERKNELENTLIIFLSDNGACAEWDPNGFDTKTGPNNILYQGPEIEKMGSAETYHSVGSGWANASNTPWRLYKHFNHEGGISSPFIAHWPAGLKSTGVINKDKGHLVDLMPTILDAAGVSYPASYKGKKTISLPGKSIVPMLNGSSSEDRILYFEHEGNRAVLEGKWKLVALRGGHWELYDLENDRTELNDLSEKYPKVVGRLNDLWIEWAKENYVTPLPENYRVPYLPTPPLGRAQTTDSSN